MTVVQLQPPDRPYDRVHALFLQNQRGLPHGVDDVAYLLGVIGDQRAHIARMEDAAWHESYREYLRSHEWRRRRELALLAAGFRCEMCGKKGRLQVHHRDYMHVFHESPNDLIVLCGTCHRRHHTEIDS